MLLTVDPSPRLINLIIPASNGRAGRTQTGHAIKVSHMCLVTLRETHDTKPEQFPAFCAASHCNMTSLSGDSNHHQPQVKGYSFYLNVVLLSSGRREEESTSASDVSTTEKNGSTEQNHNESPEVIANGAVTNPHEEAVNNMVKKVTDGKFLMGLARASMKSPLKSGENKMSQWSSSLTNKTRRFVGNMTMMSRAEKAVVEIIPQVQKDIGVELSINKRFQHGTVFVLEVDIKGTDLLSLLATTMGQKAADQFEQARDACEALDLIESKKSLEAEVLPKVRRALMQKLATLVPQTIQQRKQSTDLEIECIALEDAEEAKWLYNFLEFMQSMGD